MNDSPDAQNGTTAQNSVTKLTRRRRHDYSPEIADLICDRIAEGASLRQICQDANMPAKSTIFVWLEEHEDFARSYALARQIQIEDLMDEILEIADDSSNDWIDREGPDGLILCRSVPRRTAESRLSSCLTLVSAFAFKPSSRN